MRVAADSSHFYVATQTVRKGGVHFISWWSITNTISCCVSRSSFRCLAGDTFVSSPKDKINQRWMKVDRRWHPNSPAQRLVLAFLSALPALPAAAGASARLRVAAGGALVLAAVAAAGGGAAGEVISG